MNTAGKIVLTDWIEGYAKIVMEPLSNDKLLERFQALATGKDGSMDVLTTKDMARIVKDLGLDQYFDELPPGVDLSESRQIKDMIKQFDSVSIPEERDPITGKIIQEERPLDDVWCFEEFKEFMRP